MAGTENTIFSDAIIKLKHATKSVADASDKVLEKDEVLLVSPNSGSGTGAYEMRVGDGSTPVKNLPVAINGMKADNINVEEIETIEEENPTLEGGNAIKNLFGRISKKFSWLETMLGKKVNTADIYDGLDSSNAGKVASANAVRQINEKTDKNTTDISTLNSNLIRNEVVSTTGVYLTRSGNVRLVKFISALANSDGLIVTMSNDKPNRRTFALVESMDVSGGSPVISRVDIRTDGAIYLTDLAGNALNKVALGEIVYVIA